MILLYNHTPIPGIPGLAGVSGCLPPAIHFSWVFLWQAPQMNRSPCLSRPTHTEWWGRAHTQQLLKGGIKFCYQLEFYLLCDSLCFPVTPASTKHSVAFWAKCSLFPLPGKLNNDGWWVKRDPLLVTWKAHCVAVDLVPFQAHLGLKHPFGLLIPGLKK